MKLVGEILVEVPFIVMFLDFVYLCFLLYFIKFIFTCCFALVSILLFSCQWISVVKWLSFSYGKTFVLSYRLYIYVFTMLTLRQQEYG